MDVAIAGAHGQIDVAAVIARVLHDPQANGRVLYVNSGQQPLDEALNQALAGPS